MWYCSFSRSAVNPILVDFSSIPLNIQNNRNQNSFSYFIPCRRPNFKQGYGLELDINKDTVVDLDINKDTVVTLDIKKDIVVDLDINKKTEEELKINKDSAV